MGPEPETLIRILVHTYPNYKVRLPGTDPIEVPTQLGPGLFFVGTLRSPVTTPLVLSLR